MGGEEQEGVADKCRTCHDCLFQFGKLAEKSVQLKIKMWDKRAGRSEYTYTQVVDSLMPLLIRRRALSFTAVAAFATLILLTNPSRVRSPGCLFSFVLAGLGVDCTGSMLQSKLSHS